MSKLWGVPSRFIDDKRLLRHHQTIHQLLNACTKKFHGSSSNCFYNFAGYLLWRHYEAVTEMRLRGMRHESYVDVLWKQIPDSRRLVRFRIPRVQVLKDLKTLQERQRNAPTLSSSYGRRALHEYDVRSDELNSQAEKVAKDGFPKDVFIL